MATEWINLHIYGTGATVTIDVSRVYAVRMDEEHTEIEFRNTKDLLRVSEDFEFVVGKLKEAGWEE